MGWHACEPTDEIAGLVRNIASLEHLGKVTGDQHVTGRLDGQVIDVAVHHGTVVGRTRALVVGRIHETRVQCAIREEKVHTTL